MKVITNQGEYATVTKKMSNHFEIRCDNGVTKRIEKHRCEELVPISQLKACQEELDMNLKALYESYKKHRKVATAIHELHFELGKNIEWLEGRPKLTDVYLADLNRCKRVNVKLEEILSL